MLQPVEQDDVSLRRSRQIIMAAFSNESASTGAVLLQELDDCSRSRFSRRRSAQNGDQIGARQSELCTWMQLGTGWKRANALPFCAPIQFVMF